MVAEPITRKLQEMSEVIFDLLDEGDRKQAKYHLKRMVKKHPNHYLSLFAQGMFAATAGNTKIAEKFLRSCIAKNPKYGLAHYNLSSCYQELKDFDGVIKHSALAVRFATPEELELMGSAQTLIESITKDLPANYTIDDYLADQELFKQGIAYLELEEYQRAMLLFSRVTSRQPKNVQAWSNLGNCYIMLGDLGKARELYQQAIDLDPEYLPAITNIAFLNKVEAGEIEKPEGVNIINSHEL